MCTPVTSAVPYMPTGIAGCLVGRGISRGARKLARTPTSIKKKKKRETWCLRAYNAMHLAFNCFSLFNGWTTRSSSNLFLIK